jgi:hypothetical protein
VHVHTPAQTHASTHARTHARSAGWCSFDLAGVEAERAIIVEEWRQGLGARQRSQARAIHATDPRQLIGRFSKADSSKNDYLRRRCWARSSAARGGCR